MNGFGSFRDPSGFVFRRDGVLYRQVNYAYKDDYDRLMKSGLYQDLADSSLIIQHEEVANDNPDAYKVLKPEPIEFVSYPYEWCFSQLKDCAMTTLEIQRKALGYGMVLKDASAYNIQFHRGKPTLIDTLSFERHKEGQPWVAYRQFCQHFLAPLSLMAYRDVRLGELLRVNIDGIPIDLADKLLPLKARFKPSLFVHIHLQAMGQEYVADEPVQISDLGIRLKTIRKIVDSLEASASKLQWRGRSIEKWDKYYGSSNYSPTAFQHKRQILSAYINRTKPQSVWDLGANTGIFSRLASDRGIMTVSFDSDPAVVEANYLDAVSNNETHILPLVQDLTNPSPNLGWANQERQSLIGRGPADMVFALALVHHLAISNNVPFSMIADFLSRIGRSLAIEFVPKDDQQAQRLLATRKDIFPTYTISSFETEFSKYFTIIDKQPIKETDRTIYLMERK